MKDVNSEITRRMDLARVVADQAAQKAMEHYRTIDQLQIEKKGHQDLVSNADRGVEQQIRAALQAGFPNDGIVGEEYGNEESNSGFTWVIDPIDGTASFVRGRPGWCVVIACVCEDKTVLAVIVDPVADETFRAVRGHGAFLNNSPIAVSTSVSLADGSVGVGFCNRFPAELVLRFLRTLLVEKKGVFYQNASGALMLSYVACGRLIAYAEPHMQPWDCMAALLIIEEAGGLVQNRDQRAMLYGGERVVAACPGINDEFTTMVDQAFGDFRVIT